MSFCADVSIECPQDMDVAEGYQLMGGAYYKLYNEQLNFTEANSVCEADNAKIFDAETKQDWDELRQLLPGIVSLSLLLKKCNFLIAQT